ncbi:hypothetical protein [Streptomyces sp. RPT161]|uniref:hypothetical protein n=1 Tax=Streptomyces sp. RPT161 TaxID=3015993 RepID=UPI0022B8A9B0|nr:hypothetical protein [Streptomyces sp. RPT161]
MRTAVLAVVLACVVAGLIGFMVKGLLWLLAVACAVFLVTAASALLLAVGRMVKRNRIIRQ